MIKCFQTGKRRTEILKNEMELDLEFVLVFLEGNIPQTIISEAGRANWTEIPIFVCIAWCGVIFKTLECH